MDRLHGKQNGPTRSQNKNADPLAAPMEIDTLPLIFVESAPTTEGVAHVLSDAPMAPGGGCEIDSGGRHRPVVGVCDQQECQMRHCEQHHVHMWETRFPI